MGMRGAGKAWFFPPDVNKSDGAARNPDDGYRYSKVIHNLTGPWNKRG
jgi:hypothetical protein